MKHFLNGIAIAAALAIVPPVLAQAQTSGSPPVGTAAAPSAAPAAAHPARAARPHRPTHARRGSAARAVGSRGSVGGAPGDNVANQLNRQELQRLAVGPGPAMAAPMPPVGPGPRASGGGNIMPGAAGPVSMQPGAAEAGPRSSGGGNIPAPTGPMPMPPPPPISAPAR